jgi:hypothetical protein
MSPPNKVTADQLGRLIYEIRGHRVMLDSDLAAIYGVETKALNRAVKRNADRFPKDFMFQISSREWQNLKCQIGTSNLRAEAAVLISQIAISSSRHGGRRKLPYVFTEHGAIMAANVLNSRRAVQMSVFVVRAFLKMRSLLATNAAILKRLAEIDNGLLVHDSALRDIYQKLLPLLSPPPVPAKKRIGFHPGK